MMNELDGYAIKGMRWVDGIDECDHPASARDVTVEGGVGCAACGALLVDDEQADQMQQPGATGEVPETQVRYTLKGHIQGVTLTGEWEDLAVAGFCADKIRELGGWAMVFKVTTEKV